MTLREWRADGARGKFGVGLLLRVARLDREVRVCASLGSRAAHDSPGLEGAYRTLTHCKDGVMPKDDIPSRFLLDVVRDMGEKLTPTWNAGVERWFDEHQDTTIEDYAANFAREHGITLMGEPQDPAWAEFYRGS
jgi:hypothetical protein